MIAVIGSAPGAGGARESPWLPGTPARRFPRANLHVARHPEGLAPEGCGTGCGRWASSELRTKRKPRRDPGRLIPGDLLTFGAGARGASHVGIYVGDGRFVHASSVAGRVIESDVRRPPSRLVKVWRDTRRVLSDAGADSSLVRGDS